MEFLNNRCPICGAIVEFNPVSQSWECRNCEKESVLTASSKYVNTSNVIVNSSIKMDEFTSFRCKKCGSDVIVNSTNTVTFCVYCGSTEILKEKLNSFRIPDFIIPFKKNKNEAMASFLHIIKNKPLMPRKFKQVGTVEKISGVYIPFWAYDISCDGNVLFKCSDISHWIDSNYNYAKTSNYEADVKVHLDYERVLAAASSRFKDELINLIGPFNYGDLTRYKHDYLANFLAEKSDVSDIDAFAMANQRTMDTCFDYASLAVKHHNKIVKSNSLDLKKINTSYIMLPVWMVNIKYNNKLYTFAMNGQTGKVFGEVPLGIKECILWGLLIFFIIFSIGILIVLLSR